MVRKTFLPSYVAISVLEERYGSSKKLFPSLKKNLLHAFVTRKLWNGQWRNGLCPMKHGICTSSKAHNNAVLSISLECVIELLPICYQEICLPQMNEQNCFIHHSFIQLLDHDHINLLGFSYSSAQFCLQYSNFWTPQKLHPVCSRQAQANAEPSSPYFYKWVKLD